MRLLRRGLRRARWHGGRRRHRRGSRRNELRRTRRQHASRRARNQHALRRPGQHARWRQLGHRRVGPEPARARNAVQLLAAQVIVALRRELASIVGRADDRRLQEDHQVRLLPRTRVVAEQRAKHRDVTRVGQLLGAVGEAVLDQAAEHDDLLVVDEDRRLERTLRQDRTRARRVLHARHFLVDAEPDRAAFGDLRPHAQHEPHVAALDRLEWLHRRRRSSGRVLARDEGDVLADDDARLFVVERQQRRRGQDVRLRIVFERTHEQAEVVDDAEPRNVDRAIDDAEVEPLPDRAEVDGCIDDVVAAAARAEVRAAESLHAGAIAIGTGQHLPLDTELRGLVRRNLDDQRLDEHLRATRVETLDHGAQIVVDGLGRHDDECVVRRVRLDHCAAGRERGRRPRGGTRGERTRCRRRSREARRRCARHRRQCRRHLRRAPDRRTDWRAFCAVQPAQCFSDVRRVCVAQVHDEHVAPDARRRVELLDQLANAGASRRIVGAHEDAVRARIGDERHALLGFLRRTRPRRVGKQPVDERNDVERRRVLHRHEHRLARGRLVERRDDAIDALQVVGVIGDDDRVVRDVRRDRDVRRNQRPQHGHELRGGFIAQRDDLGDDALAARRHRAALHRSCLRLRVRFGDDLDDAIGFDRRVPLHPQRRQQRRVDQRLRYRARGRDVDRPLDARVDEEIASGDFANGLHHRVDVRVDEIQRDRIRVLRGR